jgi:tRNA G10  N-methylase Trm11
MANSLTDVYVGVKKDDPNRRTNDFYPTPPLATFVLTKYCKPPRDIVEPCAGRGNISVELVRNGHNVLSYDLNEYSDSLCSINTSYDAMELPKPTGFDGVVTNPPYHKDLPRKMAEKWIGEYDYVAMFLRLTFLEGKKRKKLFTNHPPSDIIFLSDRVQFKKDSIEPIEKKHQIGGMIAYAWFVWDKRHTWSGLCKPQWVNLEDEYDEWRLNYDKCSDTSGRRSNTP